MSTRNELVTALTERYARSSKPERSVILDEFVVVSGYHRKHAIRLLGARQKKAAPERRARRRYGNAVREALIAVWEASDRVCSKRLKPLVAVLLPALERHRRLLLEISPASMDRLLSEVRLVASGGAGAGAQASARRYGVRFRLARSATGTIRRRASSRSTSSPMPAPRAPAASCRRWC